MQTKKTPAPSTTKTRAERVLVVTGTREGRDDTWAQLAWFCDEYWIPDRVILGDARGVDAQAKAFCLFIGIEPEIKYAIWRPNGIFDNQAGFDRNQVMVDAAPPDAHMLALPHPSGRSSGTKDCAGRGRAKGLTVHVR